MFFVSLDKKKLTSTVFRIFRFAPFIHEHHDIEERYYFPWMQQKCEIPEKQFAKGHETLVAQLDEIDDICKKVIQKQGIGCDAEILRLHKKMHEFVPDMNGT